MGGCDISAVWDNAQKTVPCRNYGGGVIMKRLTITLVVTRTSDETGFKMTREIRLEESTATPPRPACPPI